MRRYIQRNNPSFHTEIIKTSSGMAAIAIKDDNHQLLEKKYTS